MTQESDERAFADDVVKLPYWQVARARRALALARSMIASGERMSPTSEAETSDALGYLSRHESDRVFGDAAALKAENDGRRNTLRAQGVEVNFVDLLLELVLEHLGPDLLLEARRRQAKALDKIEAQVRMAILRGAPGA